MPLTDWGRKATINRLFRYTGAYAFNVRLAQTIAAGSDASRVIGDITECDFDGYAEFGSPSFDAPTITGGGRGETFSDLLTWAAGAGIAAPQTIIAVYVTIAFGEESENLWAFKRLTPTVTLAEPGEEFARKVWVQDNDLVVA